jgi:transcriptional regulator with XRE-family HTH domain
MTDGWSLRDMIQLRRSERGDTIRAMARDVGVEPITISEIERGLRSLTPRMAIRIAPYCKVSPLSLLHLEASDQLARYLSEHGEPEP